MPRYTRVREACQAAKEATRARYSGLPKLPTLADLAGRIERLNQDLDGPDTITLYCLAAGDKEADWTLGPDARDWPTADHWESLPGNGKRLDPIAAARRLLFHAGEAGFK